MDFFSLPEEFSTVRQRISAFLQNLVFQYTSVHVNLQEKQKRRVLSVFTSRFYRKGKNKLHRITFGAYLCAAKVYYYHIVWRIQAM
ncbi:hypothetical protein HR11_00535 [Porphyromonas macacae]|nr:hypothetical protein HR11_00535 [Porphyromonas macacae]